MATDRVKILADGLNQVYDPGADTKADVVFVHGLRGHPRKTWEAVDPNEPSHLTFWPGDLLPETVGNVRIFTFGYPTEFATFYPIVVPETITQTTIDHHSTYLLTKLANVRQETSTAGRPIFFIAHSLGGLVCANGLSRQHALNAQIQEVVDNTCGTIFLGTPFQGSSKAPWAKIAEKFLGVFGDSNDQTVADLDKNSSKLKQISTDFHMLLRKRLESPDSKPIQVACFFETITTKLRTNFIKKDIGHIVTEDSATLIGYEPMPIHADHRTMCKFADSQLPGYIDVTGMLRTMIANLDRRSDELKRDNKVNITLGDVKQGDGVVNYGIVSGHPVGMTENAVKLEVSNVIIHGRAELDNQDTAIRGAISAREAMKSTKK